MPSHSHLDWLPVRPATWPLSWDAPSFPVAGDPVAFLLYWVPCFLLYIYISMECINWFVRKNTINKYFVWKRFSFGHHTWLFGLAIIRWQLFSLSGVLRVNQLLPYCLCSHCWHLDLKVPPLKSFSLIICCIERYIRLFIVLFYCGFQADKGTVNGNNTFSIHTYSSENQKLNICKMVHWITFAIWK